jgi:hypothetical protein
MSDINVADFDLPVGHVVFRSGKRVPIMRADLGVMQLARALVDEPTNLEVQIACLQRVLPDATVEEIETLTGPALSAIVLRSRDGIPEAETLLGESSGVGPENTTTDSPLATETPTSATG